MFEIVRAHRMRIEIDAAEVHDPEELRGVAHHDLAGGASRGKVKLHGLDPVGMLLRRPLLKKRLLVGAVHVSLEHDRPPRDPPQRALCHRRIVLYEIKLGVSGPREEHLVGVRDDDFASGGFEGDGLCHRTVYPLPRLQLRPTSMAPDYTFFTSYARLDDDKELLSEAVAELKKRVEAKIGYPIEIFFDIQELPNGVKWTPALANALRETGIIVCLCSPSYMNSPFCAKEFEVFRMRVSAAAEEHRVAIIPVVWEPVPMPAAICEFHQPRDKGFPDDYYVAGLRQLKRLKSQDENFVKAIDAIAETIKKADDVPAKLPPWPDPVKWSDLTDSLHHPESGPYGIALTVLHDKTSQWVIAKRASVWKLVEKAAGALKVGWQEVPAVDAKFAAELATAEKKRLVSLLVVDRDDAAKPPWRQMLAAAGKGKHRNVAVLVGWKHSEREAPADIQAALREIIPANVTGDYFPLGDDTA